MLVLGLESTSLHGGDTFGADEAAGDSLLPASIGRYRILRVIGSGGMGVVYEAEQDHPRRIVALKIIKPGLVGDELLRRFEQESQALGRLQHPGIAQIYEAGTVDTGFGPQPYFAMEFITGQSPRDYAESHHLNTNKRLEIMVKICDAVHHAHQRGLIHRDLKPANILVDDNAQPKILDFGVARATDSDTRSTLQTDVGQLIGTLAYMSPEQALADPMDVDTRSDVYALGVIAYELLTGRLPYAISRKIHEAIHAIREQDPARLSASSRTYRGDIETIVGKALEKERTRRYASASEMAADLRRFLRDEPISARPPSASYQLRKFTRRHKGLVGGAAAVFVILIAGITVSTSLLIRATHAEAEAKSAASHEEQTGAEAMAVQNFVRALFFAMDSSYRPALGPPTLSLNDAMDQIKHSILIYSHGQPQPEAAIREIASAIFSSQGRYDDSLNQMELALGLRRQLGPTNPHILDDTFQLAQVYLNLGQFSRAEDLLKKVFIDSRNTQGDSSPVLQSSVRGLARLYRLTWTADPAREFSEHERFFKEEIIDYYRAKSGEGNSTVQDAEDQLISLYLNFNPPKYAELDPFLQQVSVERRRSLGEGSLPAITAEKQLVSLYVFLKPKPDYVRAEGYLTELVEAQRRSLGDDNPATQATVNYLVSIYLNRPEPRYSEAEAFLKQVREEVQRKLGSNSSADRNASIALSEVYFKHGQYPEAEQLLAPLSTDAIVMDAIAQPAVLVEQLWLPDLLYPLDSGIYPVRPTPIARAMTRLKMLEHPTIVDVLDRRAQIYIKQGNVVQARKTSEQVATLLESVVDDNRKQGGRFLERPLLSKGSIAIRYIEQERFTEAEGLLDSVVDGYRQLTGKVGTSNMATLLSWAALTYSSKGQDQRAEQLLKSVLDIDRAAVNDREAFQTSLWRLAAWYMNRGRYEEADQAFDRLRRIQAVYFGAENLVTRSTTANMLDLYASGARSALALGQPDQARRFLEKSLEIRRALLSSYRNQPKDEYSINTQITMSGIGINLAMLGRYPEAEAKFTQLIANQTKANYVWPESKSAAIADLGWIQFHRQKYTDSEATLREGLQSYVHIQSDTWERYNIESMLGAVLVASKRYGEAEPYLLRSDEKLRERKPENVVESGFTGEVVPGERIITLYQEWGKPEKVAEWRQKLLTNKPSTAGTTPALR
jgi:non-specific serine/threonine protein kinase/serine/threonine-protein kinase